MKKMFLLAMAVLFGLTLCSEYAAAAAVGDETPGPKKHYTYRVFNPATTATTSPKTSRTFNVKGWGRITITAKGKTVLGNNSSLTATGSSIEVRQAPTESGPWTTAFETTTGISKNIKRDRTTTVTKEADYLQFIWTKVRQGVDLLFTVEE